MRKGLVMPPHQLHLRVYEPLVAFPPDQRRVWTDYVGAHPPSNDELVATLYEEIVRANAVTNGPRLPKERTPHAYILHHGGSVLICPVQLRFRAVRAAEGRPDLFSPMGLAHGAAAALLASLRDEERESSGPGGRWDVDDGRVRARTAIWTPPITWLMMFDPDDQVARAPNQLLMRSPIGGVLARLKEVREALGVIRGGIVPATSEVAELLRWLGDFHPKAVVELDYGGSVRSLLANRLLSEDDDGLPFDEGPADLALAMEFLHMRDVTAAVSCYQRVFQRATRAQRLARSS